MALVVYSALHFGSFLFFSVIFFFRSASVGHPVEFLCLVQKCILRNMLTLGNINVKAAVARTVALQCDTVVTVPSLASCLWDGLLAKIKTDALFFENVNVKEKNFILE